MANNSAESREAVALELTRIIADNEQVKDKSIVFDRKYVLTLYSQCFKAVLGQSIKDVFDERS